MAENDVEKKSRTQGWVDKLKALSAKIPGLAEFQARDDLREQDKLLRDYTAQKIDSIKVGIDGVKRALVDQLMLKPLPALDRLTQQLDRLRDKHRFAARGYSGAFDVKQVLDPELQKLYETDLAILEKTEAIAKNCDVLCAAAVDENSVNVTVASLRTDIGALAQLIDNRDDAVRKIGL
jgi:hypothetical protein